MNDTPSPAEIAEAAAATVKTVMKFKNLGAKAAYKWSSHFLRYEFNCAACKAANGRVLLTEEPLCNR